MGDEAATRFIEGGADMITVQSEPGADMNHTLVRIRAQGAAASLGMSCMSHCRKQPSNAESAPERTV